MPLYSRPRHIASRSGAPRAADLTPANLDPDTFPILSRHWFGVGPLRPIGSMAAEIVASPRRQRAAEHLYSLGPRPVLEALAEVEAGADLDRVLADFARLNLETVQRIGGDRFPPAPIHMVRP